MEMRCNAAKSGILDKDFYQIKTFEEILFRVSLRFNDLENIWWNNYVEQEYKIVEKSLKHKGLHVYTLWTSSKANSQQI